ncbi:YbaB/EbfC family nucleoid-associated protein [Salidesulfovibrio brasiliensis]|uniref:YbaB/EbfC family nucleoid-associated protein n=1 Tax=Salidesulfovibrio brasiliensis TaxID=221711 RepID=UPI0006D2382F|nr:YbaB/EbfC family nucleoid-associated protein [Salidesulfovibrio brasiliensis]
MRGMNEMMRQAQLMQKKMTAIQEEMKTREVESSAGGGMVKVKATCGKEIVSVEIEPSVIESGDVEMIQDLVLTAVNDALNTAGEIMEKEMSSITGGMKLPGGLF